MKYFNYYKNIIVYIFLFQVIILALPQARLFTMDELVNESNFIVSGKVISISCFEGTNGRIYSDIKFQVSKVYKGHIQTKQELIFTFMGGTIGNRTTTVPEYPQFKENSESILFMNNKSDDKESRNSFFITGLTQGKFDIISNGDKIVRDKFMSIQININDGKENKFIDNKRSVSLSEFVRHLEFLIYKY